MCLILNQEGIYYKWASVKMTLKFHFLWSTLFWLEESVSAVYSDWLRGKSERLKAEVWRRNQELFHLICTPGVPDTFYMGSPIIPKIVKHRLHVCQSAAVGNYQVEIIRRVSSLPPLQLIRQRITFNRNWNFLLSLVLYGTQVKDAPLQSLDFNMAWIVDIIVTLLQLI